jgi:replicative DNA helicase
MESQATQDITKKHRSIVHDYFTLDEENNKYMCDVCNKVYKVAKDGSTSSLLKHLKNKHDNLFTNVDEITGAMSRLDITEQLVCIFTNLYITI